MKNFIRVTNDDTLNLYSALKSLDTNDARQWERGKPSLSHLRKITGLAWINQRFVDYASALFCDSGGAVYEHKDFK